LNHGADEERRLQLLSDLRDELASALNSLGDKESRGLHDNYTFHAAIWAKMVTEAFILLRREGRMDASKLLVRPVMETMFRVHAVRAQPELLFQIAYTERLEDQKWVRRAAARAGKVYDDKSEEDQWNAFKHMYQEQCPAHALDETKISSFEVAAKAGLGPYYDSHYRTYCKYEHAALRAIGGSLNDLTDSEDTRTMAMCVFATLNCVAAIGAEALNLQTLRDRLNTLDAPLQP
jgi:hypothetical protein